MILTMVITIELNNHIVLMFISTYATDSVFFTFIYLPKVTKPMEVGELQIIQAMPIQSQHNWDMVCNILWVGNQFCHHNVIKAN